MVFRIKDAEISVTFQTIKHPRIFVFIILFLASWISIPWWGNLFNKAIVNIVNILSLSQPTWAQADKIGWLAIFILCGSISRYLNIAIDGIGKTLFKKSGNLPISIRLKPIFNIRSLKKRFSQEELKNNFDYPPKCILKRGGFLVDSDEHIIPIDYKFPFPNVLTATATYKSLAKNSNWKYGIIAKQGDKKDADYSQIDFFIDYHDRITIHGDNGNLGVQYRSEKSFSNRFVKLSLYISRGHTIKITYLFFLDNTHIYTYTKDDNGSEHLISIVAWSNQGENHRVRIKDIWIAKDKLVSWYASADAKVLHLV